MNIRLSSFFFGYVGEAALYSILILTLLIFLIFLIKFVKMVLKYVYI